MMSPFSRSAQQQTPASIMGPRIVLLLCSLILMLLGFVMVYSASSVIAINEGSSSASYLIDQIKYAAVGVVCALVLWKMVSPSVWKGPWLWILWFVAVGLLALTAVTGLAKYGATRWLVLGPVSFQPSEFVKIAFILVAARILYEFRLGTISARTMFAMMGLMILLPLLFLYKTQSDLGTTLICVVGIVTVLWHGEVPLRIILLIVGVCIAFAFAAVFFTDYRSGRMVFLDPWDDGQNGYGDGYQIIRSFYAFSEGGIFGVGLGNSHEKFLYLFAAETDFIFAIIGEELGLIGAMLVIVLFLIFLYAGMRIVQAASDSFDAMIAGSCTIMIVFQAFLNMGCVIGVLPTTGKPLPFISSGGSSLVATLIMVGLILSVSQASAGDIHAQRRDDLRIVRAEMPRSTHRKNMMPTASFCFGKMSVFFVLRRRVSLWLVSQSVLRTQVVSEDGKVVTVC